MSKQKISVIGLGYIGLPTAAVLASTGIEVLGVDIDAKMVGAINGGKTNSVEPGLAKLVDNVVTTGVFTASIEPQEADVFIVAVPTPFRLTDSLDSLPEPDLSYVETASRSIAAVLKKGDLVILESTCPVGTTEKMVSWMSEERVDLTFPISHGENSDIRVAYCPERVLPGKILRELVENDRIIGGVTPRCAAYATEVYNIFVSGECFLTDARTAEMSKLTENASRDVDIAFANELSILCDDFDIDVWELISLANRHPRVNILNPGPGVGGHCIAVDPWFIISQSPGHANLMHQARRINDEKPLWVLDKVKAAIADVLLANPYLKVSELTIACYGLSFKADVDDLRGSPAVFIAKNICKFHTGKVLLVEPHLNKLPGMLNNHLSDVATALSLADIHVLLVDHTAFDAFFPTNGIIIDTRGMWRDH